MVMSQNRLRGLDSLRFVAAIWVALSHGAALPLRELLDNKGAFAQMIASAHGLLFNGVAAVMMFFIISGFCIHYPWAQSSKVAIGRFLIRRYIRIGIPLVVVNVIAYISNDTISSAANSVLWSIYCEIIYYTLYPFLFFLFRKFSIVRVLCGATLIAILIVVTHWPYLYEWQFGPYLTWLVGLPTWLLGCLIAERTVRGDLIAGWGSIWIWRAGAIAYSATAVVILYHSPIKIGYPATMLLFSFYLFIWIQKEIRFFSGTPALSVMEWGGRWSYSLYLMHNIVITQFDDMKLKIPIMAIWAAKLFSISLISYVFYLLIENPSHWLARWAGSKPNNSEPPETLPISQSSL